MIWHDGLKKDIIGIPLKKVAPQWNSSTPLPEAQLSQLSRMGFDGKFLDYEKNKELLSMIAGKRLAFVGPSPHLEGMKQGKMIDGYDFIIRVNQNFHTPAYMVEDYGARTDIGFNCLNVLKINSLLQNMDYVRSLKFMVCPMVSMWDIGKVNSFLDSTNIPWHNVEDGYLFKIFKDAGTICNTGLAGIITLLNYDIKELYITGMTFYNMGTFGSIYNDKYHDEAFKHGSFKDTRDKQPSVGDLRIDIHQQEPQIEYFRKIVEKHHGSRMTLDKYLLENFVEKTGEQARK
jgi:hypothetical protein